MRKLLYAVFILAACRCATSEITHEVINDGLARSVWVDTWMANGDFGNCSGVVLQTGVILTAKHCQGVKMTVNGLPATVTAVDEKDDLLLLKVDGPLYSPLSVATKFDVGDKVFGVGTITDLPAVYSQGYVMKLSANYGDIHVRPLVSLHSAPGISGGGVYNVKGQLIGVMVQYRTARFFAGEKKEPQWGLLCGSIVEGSEIKRFLDSTKGKS